MAEAYGFTPKDVGRLTLSQLRVYLTPLAFLGGGKITDKDMHSGEIQAYLKRMRDLEWKLEACGYPDLAKAYRDG
jgi:hypothetical protein